MNLGLEGRRAAVAAASAGLGFATAQALAAEGVTVAICGRDRGRIDAAAARIGDLARPVVADVGSPDGAEAFIEEARDALGGAPDIVVANAGGPPPGTFESTDINAYRAAIDLNLLSTVAMCRAAVPAMREQKWGRIVAITSVVVKQPAPYLVLSNTARAGVHGFLKTVAGAVARDGVTVNALMPGSHDTERMRVLYGDSSKMAEHVPMGYVGQPEDFGAVAAFLCSDHARYITGASLPVDGGTYGGLF